MNLPTDELIGLAWSQIWQVTVLLAIVAVATRLVCRRRPHLAYVLWMLVVLKCLTPPLWSSPTGLFSWLQLREAAPMAESRSSAADAASSEAKLGPLVEKTMRWRKHLPAISTSVGAATAARIQTIEESPAPQRWHVSWTAIAAATWLAGVFGIAGVLLWKWTAYGRILRRAGSSATAELESLAERIAERLDLRRAVRLRIVSEPIGPAVFGLCRPVVVIPEAVIREKPLQEIEPIVAHELVHVRRGDAFVGVLQMAVQIVWWFHPLVWWANREMCRWREQCCDEEVLAGLGCSSAAYARCLVDVLEWECCRGRRQLLSAVPGVGSAEITTTRLEHIMDDAKRFHRRTPRWTWGLLAMAMLLVLPGRALVLGQNAEPLSTKDAKATEDTTVVKDDADRVPTLAEIAKANSAAWNAIQSVDVEYVVALQCVEDDKLTRDTQSTVRWSKSASRERLRTYPVAVKINQSRFGSVPPPEIHDYFLDGKTLFHLRDLEPENKNKGELSPMHQQFFEGEMTTDASGLSIDRKDREPLRYLWFPDPPLDLSEIIASWKVSLRGKQTTSTGETLWLIHAEYPPKDDKDKFAGTYIDIQVNANKGFLVQKAFLLANGIAYREIGKDRIEYISSCSVTEVKEFRDCGHGVFFPKRTEFRLIGELKEGDSKNGCYSTITATKLSVNSPLPADAFDFRFPENLEVQQVAGNTFVKMLLWGPNNKPGKTFDSVEEFQRYADKDEFERLSRKVKANVASKKPADLWERGQYYVHAKDYDAAITAFSEAISADPKSEEADNALCGRGFTYLLYKRDFEKAAVDFTEIIERASKQKDDDATMVYYLRGLAYANQEKTLDKAVDDLTRLLSEEGNKSCLAGDTPYWAYLLRATIRARQGKNARDFDLAMQDSVKALEHSKSAGAQLAGKHLTIDYFVVATYISERRGNHEEAADIREKGKRFAEEREKGKAEQPLELERLEADLAAAAHDCVMKLVPEVEKK